MCRDSVRQDFLEVSTAYNCTGSGSHGECDAEREPIAGESEGRAPSGGPGGRAPGGGQGAKPPEAE